MHREGRPVNGRDEREHVVGAVRNGPREQFHGQLRVLRPNLIKDALDNPDAFFPEPRLEVVTMRAAVPLRMLGAEDGDNALCAEEAASRSPCTTPSRAWHRFSGSGTLRPVHTPTSATIRLAPRSASPYSWQSASSAGSSRGA